MLPRPRTVDVFDSPEFMRLRRQVHQAIREESLKALTVAAEPA